MKKLIFTLSIFTSILIQAQTANSIYGMAVAPGPATYLGKLAPATGSVTNISGSSLGPNYVGSLATINPKTNIYYYETGTNQFVGVDLITGNVVSNPTMTNPLASFFDLVAYNCADSTIYGLARATLPTRLYLAKINPNTGVVTNISASTIGSGSILTPSTIDPVNKRFYFEDGSFLFTGVDMVTGNVATNPPLSYSSSNANLFDCFVYNCKDSTIYGLARRNSPAQMYLSKVNPTTGLVTLISPTNINPNGQTAGGATIDALNNIFYFQDGNQNIIGLDLATGTIVTSAPETNTGANSITNFRSTNLCSCNPLATSITEISPNNSQIKVYPNPGSDDLTIILEKASAEKVQVDLVDVTGKMWRTITITPGQITGHLILDSVRSGTYFVKIYDGAKNTITQKAVITKD